MSTKKTKPTEAERRAELVSKQAEQIRKNPLRLLQLMARASEGHYCTSVNVYGNSVNPDPWEEQDKSRIRVEFALEGEDLSCVLYITSDDYEIEAMFNTFDLIDARREKERQKLTLARETYDKLTDEERNALGLTRRP